MFINLSASSIYILKSKYLEALRPNMYKLKILYPFVKSEFLVN